MKISQLTTAAGDVPRQPTPTTEPRLTPQQAEQIFDGPLWHLCWWDLLMALWTSAHDYKLDWAAAFPDHIISVDIAWLRRAMHRTFQRLSAEHQALLREEYDLFVALDEVCDWKAMSRGHEYLAVVCTKQFPDVRLKCSVFAWSLDEAKARFTPSPAEILLGWMRPPDRDYVRVEQEISGDVSL